MVFFSHTSAALDFLDLKASHFGSPFVHRDLHTTFVKGTRASLLVVSGVRPDHMNHRMETRSPNPSQATWPKPSPLGPFVGVTLFRDTILPCTSA